MGLATVIRDSSAFKLEVNANNIATITFFVTHSHILIKIIMHNMAGVINGLEAPTTTHLYDMPRGWVDHTPRSSYFLGNRSEIRVRDDESN